MMMMMINHSSINNLIITSSRDLLITALIPYSSSLFGLRRSVPRFLNLRHDKTLSQFRIVHRYFSYFIGCEQFLGRFNMRRNLIEIWVVKHVNLAHFFRYLISCLTLIGRLKRAESAGQRGSVRAPPALLSSTNQLQARHEVTEKMS